jgi:hypothetical protein
MLKGAILYIVLAVTQGHSPSIREDLTKVAEKYKRECTGDGALDAFYRDEQTFSKKCDPLELELQRLKKMKENLPQ